jgi:hypothetical protein
MFRQATVRAAILRMWRATAIPRAPKCTAARWSKKTPTAWKNALMVLP